MSKEDELIKDLTRHPDDVSLWSAFYDLIEPHLRLFSLSLMRRSKILDPSEAEDVVQDVLLSFVRNFARTRSGFTTFTHVRNYLFKACRNRFLNRLEQKSIQLESQGMLSLRFSEVSSEAFRKAFAEVENRALVQKLLSVLDDTCREMASSYLLENKTLAEFAAQRGIRLGTVYARWQICLEAMRKILSDRDKEEAN